MYRPPRCCSGAVALALLIAGPGCGGNLVKVKGVVTLDGKPVKDAAVLFECEGAESRPATGRTDGDGVFTLSTYKPGDGVRPGDYKVVITPPQNVPLVSDRTDMSFEEAMALRQKGLQEMKNKPPPFGAGIPARFRDLKQTPLRQKVPPDGPVSFDFQSEAGQTPAPNPALFDQSRREPESKGKKESRSGKN